MSATTVYTFSSVSFRRLDPDNADDWFPQTITYTQDQVLDSGIDYFDVGAAPVYGPLQLKVEFNTLQEREAAMGMLGQTNLLSNNKVWAEASATLISIKRIILPGARARYGADVTFVWRPLGS